jgi:hypothetical protein
MVTLVAPVRLVPVRVIRVAPVAGPRTGETPVTVGAATTVATGTSLLLTVLLVTTAFSAPALNPLKPVTVKVVAVEAVTVPLPAGVKTTVLLPAVGENPKPLIVRVVAPIARLAVLLVTTGATLATGTALPLLTVLLVTTAFKVPALKPLKLVTVREVVVAAVTVPLPAAVKITALLPAVGENPKPLIVRVVAPIARSAVLLVITGITVATGTAGPLGPPSLVTTAVSGPALAGPVESATVNWVAVAAVTVPTALLLKTTILLAATGSKLAPSIVTLAVLAARPPVPLVTTGAAR